MNWSDAEEYCYMSEAEEIQAILEAATEMHKITEAALIVAQTL